MNVSEKKFTMGQIVKVEYEGIFAGEAIDTYHLQIKLPNGTYLDIWAPKDAVEATEDL